jgi:hypothetical protein
VVSFVVIEDQVISFALTHGIPIMTLKNLQELDALYGPNPRNGKPDLRFWRIGF